MTYSNLRCVFAGIAWSVFLFLYIAMPCWNRTCLFFSILYLCNILAFVNSIRVNSACADVLQCWKSLLIGNPQEKSGTLIARSQPRFSPRLLFSIVYSQATHHISRLSTPFYTSTPDLHQESTISFIDHYHHASQEAKEWPPAPSPSP